MPVCILGEAGWRGHWQWVYGDAVQIGRCVYGCCKDLWFSGRWLLSQLAAEVQAHLAIMDTIEGRWRLEWIVEPFEQVAIYEQLLTQ